MLALAVSYLGGSSEAWAWARTGVGVGHVPPTSRLVFQWRASFASQRCLHTQACTHARTHTHARTQASALTSSCLLPAWPTHACAHARAGTELYMLTAIDQLNHCSLSERRCTELRLVTEPLKVQVSERWQAVRAVLRRGAGRALNHAAWGAAAGVAASASAAAAAAAAAAAVLTARWLC